MPFPDIPPTAPDRPDLCQIYLVELDDDEETEVEPDPAHASASASNVELQPAPPSDSGSDSDAEPESSIDRAEQLPEISPVMFSRPRATGSDRPPFELIDKMTYTAGKDRLIFVDFVYPIYRGRLKAGYTVFLVVMDYKTLHVDFKPLRSKDDAARAFECIGFKYGWHKVPHTVYCISDGENKLVAEIATACHRLGMSPSTSIPNNPASNRAGSNVVRSLRRMTDCALLDATAHGNVINGSFEAIAFGEAVSMYNLLPHPHDPLRRSPFELTFGITPEYCRAPFGTPGFMPLSSNARREAEKRGCRAGQHATEPMLYIGTANGHLRGLTERGTSRCGPMYLDLTAPTGLFPGTSSGASARTITPQPAAAAPDRLERLRVETGQLLTSADSSTRIAVGPKKSSVPYLQNRCDALIGKTVAEALQSEFVLANGQSRRYRRDDLQYDIRTGRLCLDVTATEAATVSGEEAAQVHLAAFMVLEDQLPSEVHAAPAEEQRSYARQAANVIAQKDLPWRRFLAPTSPHRQDVINAFDKEISAVIGFGVMDEVVPGSAEYAEAVRRATLCRPLLDRKADASWKARVVKRGDLEDTAVEDGPDYVFFSHVASLASLRLTILQPERYYMPLRTAVADFIELSSCDVSNAFCQSDDFGDAVKRFLKVHSPVDGIWRYYRQKKPLYGAKSAPRRWNETFVRWITTPIADGGPGFVRGKNEPSIFRREHTESHGALLLCLYVDDLLLSGPRAVQDQFYSMLRARFTCKDVKWLAPETPLTHLGMQITMDDEFTYLSMSQYISNMATILHLEGCAPMAVPFVGSITDFKEISKEKKEWHSTALGMLGWVSSTVRLDVRHCHSRLAQYTANPCQGSYDALVLVCRYLISTANLSLRQTLNQAAEWRMFCDSDMGSNAEPGNKRRSQLGYIVMWGMVPIVWSSKVTSVGFTLDALPAGFPSTLPPVTAHPEFKAEHVATSSAEAEIYSLALFTNEILSLSYAVQEAGFTFPRPAVVQVDNQAAIAFSRQADTGGRSRLRHIDLRQEWVHLLRESGLVTCVHVSTVNNLADCLTKALDHATFKRLRDQLMYWCPH